MIPKNIKRGHVLKAIQYIERHGIPASRKSKKFKLEFNGKYYPPKYVVSLASRFASGRELDTSLFSGGNETNEFLRKLGFEIYSDTKTIKKKERVIRNEMGSRFSKTHHGERCKDCKIAIENLLKKIYGEVKPNYKFDIGVHPENFKNTFFYENLKDIYESLQNHRGYRDFVRAKNIPHCDYFIPNPGFVIEFDESQHFTLPRKISLTKYPKEVQFGFDVLRWSKLCDRINSKDNDPPFRDEQRAWYDTLRDFLPYIQDLKPTVRLFSQDIVWCNLDFNRPSDEKRFKSFLKKKQMRWKIELREDSDPDLARIIIADEWIGDQIRARELLEEVCRTWPKGKKVKFLVTCGGFIQFEWPKTLNKQDIGDNKYPKVEIVDFLVRRAEECAEFILSSGLGGRLKEFTDYISLGIDSFKEKISTTQNLITHPHIELVLLIDLKRNKFYWSGKSYPTSSQQRGLVRISDLERHFFDLPDVGNIMILGCHDLTIFNPRSRNAKGWRERVNSEFRKMSIVKKPTVVLQHPHTTDSVLTWAAAWNGLRNVLPNVKIYASAGRYHNEEGERSRLEDVLLRTKYGNSIDFIVQNPNFY